MKNTNIEDSKTLVKYKQNDLKEQTQYGCKGNLVKETMAIKKNTVSAVVVILRLLPKRLPLII